MKATHWWLLAGAGAVGLMLAPEMLRAMDRAKRRGRDAYTLRVTRHRLINPYGHDIHIGAAIRQSDMESWNRYVVILEEDADPHLVLTLLDALEATGKPTETRVAGV